MRDLTKAQSLGTTLNNKLYKKERFYDTINLLGCAEMRGYNRLSVRDIYAEEKEESTDALGSFLVLAGLLFLVLLLII